MLVITSESHRGHDTVEIHDGQLAPSFESPKRVDMISDALRHSGHEFRNADDLDDSLLRSVHDGDYVDFMATMWERWLARFPAEVPAIAYTTPMRGNSPKRPDDLVGQLCYHSFAADTSVVAGTCAAAVGSAAIAQTAADRVADGLRSVYGLCRPPGHHATTDQFGGYCFFNNAAIAAQRLRDRGAATVAVLDVDYHHGNGTQQIFERRADVLTISLHADPVDEFPWFSGYADETGVGAGEGHNLNLPIPCGADVGTWHDALATALQHVTAFAPDALVIPLGVDTFHGDPLGTFGLERDDFAHAGAAIAALGLPTVIVQEGGYAVDDIGHNVAAFLGEFERLSARA